MSTGKICVICFFVSLKLQAQSPIEQDTSNNLYNKINNYLTSAVDANKFNGLALIAKDGQIIFHKAYGWRNFDTQSYNDTTIIFPILSMTKSFTAMIVLKLQEQGRLSVNDKLAKYLPDFPNANNITIEQLLTHTSGIHNFTDDIGEEDSGLVNHPVTQEIMLNFIAGKPADFQPGKGFSYNNSGYYLVGVVIEKATQKSYYDNVKALIFDPLGMKHSGFDFNGLPDNTKAKGYQIFTVNQKKTYQYLDSTVSFSAGSIYSTCSDLYKWSTAVANKQILSAASWKYAFKRKASDFGIGFRINQLFGHDYIKHEGGYPGFASEFIYYPRDNISIVLLKNTGNYGEDIWPVTIGLSSIVFGLPYDNWKPRQAVHLTDETLKEKEGNYVAGKLTIRFVVKDHQLYEVLSDGTDFPLLAENDQSFYLYNFNSSSYFKKNEQGKVVKVIIHEHGKDLELTRSE